MAVISDNIVYASVAIKNVSSKKANVITKNIAKISKETNNGFFIIFCNIIEIIITAIGNAKNINKLFIFNLHMYFLYIMIFIIFLIIFLQIFFYFLFAFFTFYDRIF